MVAAEFVVRTFGGPVEILVDGAALRPLRSRKGEWLLALLAVQHGREVTREWIADGLWPETEPEAANRSLRQSLWDLRQALGTQSRRIEAPRPRTLRLNLTGAEVDVVAFDRAVAQGDPSALEQAVALYRGPFLDGCEEPWAFAEREQRRRSFLNALERLAAHQHESGEEVGAVDCWRRLLAADPLRESALCGLMRSLERSGDPAGAVAAYQEFVRRLRRDEPLRRPREETTRLCNDLRRRPSIPNGFRFSAGPFGAFPAARPMPEPVVVVGREEEIGHVTALLRGRRLVTLTGGAGVGKSCLAQAVVERLAWDFCRIDFSLVLEPIQVAEVAAHALGLRPVRATLPLLGVLDALRSRRPLLLLDNCERHQEAAVRLADAVLTHCPEVRLLATGRRLLGLADEQPYTVLRPAWEDVRQRLLDRAFDANTPLDSDGNTLLLGATFWGYDGVTKFLLDMGADVNCVHRTGFTPLLNVIKFGHPHLVPMLLQAGAQVNVHTPSGETPLSLAVERGLWETVRELLAAGADPSVLSPADRSRIIAAEADEAVATVPAVGEDGSVLRAVPERRTFSTQ